MNLDSEDKEKIRDVLVKFYGKSVERININDEVYKELVKLIQASEACTNAMHFVPRPVLFGDPVKWLKKEIIKSITRFLTSKENEHYISCLRVSAIARKTRIILASQGL